MKLLELFCGTKSVGKAAKELGFDVFSVDLDPKHKPDLVADVLKWETDIIPKLPWRPDVVWASPPCTAFSVAAIGRNWDVTGGYPTPKSTTAKHGLALLDATIQCIGSFDPAVRWFLENPRGMMRKVIRFPFPSVQQTVTYCQYGDTRMKPTDIWTNVLTWSPKPPCKNGDTCHVAAPRGSRTGTQGLKGAVARGVIPHSLCLEVMSAAKDTVPVSTLTPSARVA